MVKQWHSDDITFCTNKKCKTTKCMRNSKNIRIRDIPHSFADLDGNKDYCLKKQGELNNNDQKRSEG